MIRSQHGVEAVVDDLVRLENERCSAMMAGDKEKLRRILHPALVHVHAKGQIDSYDSYFASGGFKVDYRNVQRFGDLTVHVIGDAALMTGRQLLEAIRKATGERVRIDSQVMQVWARHDGSWRQLAFQTTPTEMSES